MGRVFNTRDEMTKHYQDVVNEHLHQGEDLRAVLMAAVSPNTIRRLLYGPLAAAWVRYFYIGLTEDHLILVERDSRGRPVGTRRLSRSDIESVRVRHGLIGDTMIVHSYE